MKIAVDARWIFPEVSGVGAYTLALILELTTQDDGNDYLILFNNQLVREDTVDSGHLLSKANVETRFVASGVFSLSSQTELPRLLKECEVDVYHSPNYMIPFFAFPRKKKGRTACVTTIHDVIPLVFPDHAPRSRKSRMFWLYRLIMKEVGVRSDAIITVSNASRRDILEHLRIPEELHAKVRTVYNGVADSFEFKSRRARRSETKPRTLLYVGRSDPYKNVTGLVRIFAKVRELCEFPVELMIIGSVDPRYPEARRLVEELGVQDLVKWSGYIEQENLVKAYHEADVLVHPSRYEGFGLQVIEAMACGLPVVCGDGGSLPEVAGDGAVVLDPDDTAGFVENVVRILHDSVFMKELTQKGKEQASHFTWAEAARKTLEVYEEVASNGGVG